MNDPFCQVSIIFCRAAICNAISFYSLFAALTVRTVQAHWFMDYVWATALKLEGLELEGWGSKI